MVRSGNIFALRVVGYVRKARGNLFLPDIAKTLFSPIAGFPFRCGEGSDLGRSPSWAGGTLWLIGTHVCVPRPTQKGLLL